MATNFKNELMETVTAMGTEVEGKLQITKRKLAKVQEMLVEGFGGKFTLVSNKKDDTIHAIVYKTKKSDKIIILKVVEEPKKKATKEPKEKKVREIDETKKRFTTKVFREVKEDGRQFKIIKVYSFGKETGFETWLAFEGKRTMVKKGTDFEELKSFINEQ